MSKPESKSKQKNKNEKKASPKPVKRGGGQKTQSRGRPQFQEVKSTILSAKNELVFALNGERVAIKADQVDPLLTLNDYIRDHTKWKGTKLGCGEGGCGACAVVAARYDNIKRQVVEISINSCLKPLAAIDGWNIVTVEGLGGSEKGYHPIQDRIASFHGTQCGFCTPGMVMTLYGGLKSAQAEGGKNITMKEVEAMYDGNICRCTGYRPILDAAKSFAKDSDVKDWLTGTTTGPYDDSKDPAFPAFLREHKKLPLKFRSTEAGLVYYRALNLKDVFNVLAQAAKDKHSVKLIVGNTSVGIYKTDKYKVYLDVASVPELLATVIGESAITVGGSVTLVDFIKTLRAAKKEQKAEKVASFDALVDHALRVANVHVRNAGSVAGNLFMAKTQGFISDLATILLGASAKVTLATVTEKRVIPIEDFLASPDVVAGEILHSITVPYTQEGDVFRSYKTAIRSQNAHAYVNAAFHVNLDEKKNITKAVLAYGGVMEWDVKGSHPIRASETERALIGKTLNSETVQLALATLKETFFKHIQGEHVGYRKSLVSGFLFKFLLSAIKDGLGRNQSATVGNSYIDRGVSRGKQEFHLDSKDKDVTTYKPLAKIEGKIQASGEARYICDIPLEAGALHATYVLSTIARGKIQEIDTKATLASSGVVRVITAKDIPALNSYPCIPGFPLPPCEFLADTQIEYLGQPIALVLANTKRHADTGAALVKVKYEAEEAVVSLAAAIEKKFTFSAPFVDTVVKGDAKAALEASTHRAQGSVDLGSQTHFYMETQGVYAVPEEEGQLTLYVASQFPSGCSSNVAAALGIPENKIKVVLRRAGGGFGGKATHVLIHTLTAALCAWIVKRPVRVQLNRNEDMHMHGGREETTTNYEVGFDKNGKVTALRHRSAMNAGWSPDISLFILYVINGSMSQVYNLPVYDGISTLYKTNLSTRTAVRGPGEVTASYVMETALAHIAHILGISPELVRERNFFDEKEKDPKTPKGGALTHYTIHSLWPQIKKKVKYDERAKAVAQFNKDNRWKKRGVAITPVSYHVNVGSKDAVVNVINDGSIVIHHCGCEMGQGLNTKAVQVAASTLGEVLGAPLDVKLIRMQDVNTHVIPNGRGTGGSTGSEGVCAAVLKACNVLVGRLKTVYEGLIKEAEEKKKKEAKEAKEGKAVTSPPEGKEGTKITWEGLIATANKKEVPLTAHAKFGTDGDTFGYYNYGVGFSEVEIDVLTGESNIIKTEILYDCGKSLNPAIDVGQSEGAFVMGVGHILREDMLHDATGKLTTDGTWTYKPPGVKDIPMEFNVEMLNSEGFDRGILSSKSSGEPPLVLAVSVAMGIRNAIASARADAGNKDWFELPIPMTPNIIQQACLADKLAL